MTLRDVVVRNELIELSCSECGSHTPLDPAFFLARRGNISLSALSPRLVCPACGSADIWLEPAKPYDEQRRA